MGVCEYVYVYKYVCVSYSVLAFVLRAKQLANATLNDHDAHTFVFAQVCVRFPHKDTNTPEAHTHTYRWHTQAAHAACCNYSH